VSRWWKVLVGLALVVPLGAYVLGSLAASTEPPSAERAPVVIPARGLADDPTPSASSSPGPDTFDGGSDAPRGGDGTASGGPEGQPRSAAPKPQRVVPPPAPADDDDDGDDDEGDDDGDDDDEDDGDDDGDDD
jgi:hypothetical protein